MKLLNTIAIVAFIAIAIFNIPVFAQDRMNPVAPDQYNDAQRKAAEEFKAARGYEVRGPFLPLIRSPEIMTRARAMGDYLRYRTVLGARLNEMAILITLRDWTAGYEWAAHYPIALQAGLKKEIADAIGDGRRPEGMGRDEEALYDLSIEILHEKRVSEITYKHALEVFGEQGVVEILSVHGYYSFLAIVNNATRTCTVQIATAACPAWQNMGGVMGDGLHPFPN